jgi:hypothetical protein
MLFGVPEHHCGLDVHLHQRMEYHSIERDLSLSCRTCADVVLLILRPHSVSQLFHEVSQ